MAERVERPLRILMLEDVPADAVLIEHALKKGGLVFQPCCVATEAEFALALDSFKPDIILSDFSLPRFNALHALELLRQKESDLPFVLVTGSQSEEVAAACIKEGADDYLLKSSLQRLPVAVKSALKVRAVERAERKLRGREEHFKALIENATDIITVLDQEGVIRYESPSLERLLGYAPEELVGQRAFSLVHPGDLEPATARFEELLRRPGGTTRLEYRFKHKNGSWRILETVGSNLLAEPEVQGIVANSRDVTERKLAEEKILDQAALLDKAQDAIWVQTLEGRVTYWNQSAVRLHGWSSAEAVGKPVRELFRLEAGSGIEEALKGAEESGEWSGDLQLPTKSGSVVTVESRWTLVRDSERAPKSLLVINTDVTEKKKFEAHFFRAQRMESIGVLAGGIAHDLNNVLTPASVAIKLLRDEMGSETAVEILRTLETSIERGASIVNQVLSFARGMEGERTLVQVKYPLKELFTILRETFGCSITVQTQIQPDLWAVLGDATQLHQVFMNLCVNARDAMPHGGRLLIQAENIVIDENYARMQPEARAGRYILVTISDSGTGIPPDLLNRIFEPFFTTKEIGKGTGLGLSTAVGIVRSHGGFLNVYSEVGKGARFRVYLPATTGAAATPKDKPAPEALRGAGERVLIADDEESIRDIVRITLEAHGYHVYTAGDGAEAVAVYAQHRDEIAAVIVDSMMPVMDGSATIRALQRIDPKSRVIAVSGLTENENIRIASENGRVLFLAKPFTTEQILFTLHNLLHGELE